MGAPDEREATIDAQAARARYAEELARRRLKRDQIMREATRMYSEWYRKVGDRMEARGVHAGNHRDEVLAPHVGATCWIPGCGKATKALGLCITCYCRASRRAHDPRYRRRYYRANVYCKHFDRPHHGHGFCRECYEEIYRPMRNARKRAIRGARRASLILRTDL